MPGKLKAVPRGSAGQKEERIEGRVSSGAVDTTSDKDILEGRW